MNIMDLNAFLIEMDNDYDDVNIIVTEFNKSIEAQIPQMLKLLEDKDFDTLKREAHSIKGGARNLMAPGLEFAATDLEFAAKDSNIVKSKVFLLKLEDEFIKFKYFILENLFINH